MALSFAFTPSIVRGLFSYKPVLLVERRLDDAVRQLLHRSDPGAWSELVQLCQAHLQVRAPYLN